MNTVLVWVLVSVGGYTGDQVVYSPPMPDQASCEFLQKSMPNKYNRRYDNRCVQIKMVVSK